MATETVRKNGIYSGRQPNPARLAYLRLMADAQDEEAGKIEEYRQFYKGEHPTMLSQRQATYLNVAIDSVFSFNHCPIVVDSLVERLRVTGFAAGEDEALAKQMWMWWKANRMDAQQMLVHTYAARDGVAFMIVDWNTAENRPGFYVNEAWDGDSGVKVHWAGSVYPGQKILFASKRWREEFEGAGSAVETYRRLNIYYPDRIEKYKTSADDESGWERYWDEGEDHAVWPLPWVDREGRPLGVPVAPFLNKQTGVSELKDVLPLQVAINKTLVDLLAAADVEGFGIFTKTGGVYIDNPKVFPGAFWQDTDPEASWGKLPGSELQGLLSTLDRLTQAVAVVTRRPLSYFTGQATTSGEHLKQMEAGLVSTARAAHVVFGNAYEDMMTLGMRLAETYGGQSFASEETSINCEWADAETRNETEHTTQVLNKVKEGVIDDYQALRELNYDADTIRAILIRKEMEKLRAMARRPQVADGGQKTEGGGNTADGGQRTENGGQTAPQMPMQTGRPVAAATEQEIAQAEQEAAGNLPAANG